MKTIAVIILMFIIASARGASTHSLHCSNADGSIKWTDSKDLKVFEFENKPIALNLVEINLLDKNVLNEKLENVCGYYHHVEVFSALAKVKSFNDQDDLRRYPPFGSLESFVICQKELLSTFVCRQ